MMEGEKRMMEITLAACNITCVVINTFDGLFTASVINNRVTTLVINPVNNTKLHVQLVNGTLTCTRDVDNMSSSCGLHYVCKCTRAHAHTHKHAHTHMYTQDVYN